MIKQHSYSIYDSSPAFSTQPTAPDIYANTPISPRQLQSKKPFLHPYKNILLIPASCLECGYHVLMSSKGCCQNSYSSMWQCCGIFGTSEFDIFILQNTDKVICHEAYRPYMISYFSWNIYKIIIHHLQHIRFMSHVAYTADNVTDTKVLIIKTNSLHMGKTQK